jgi:hypothetical protein
MTRTLAILILMTSPSLAGWCDPTRDECWSRPEPPQAKPQVRAWVKHQSPPPRVIIKKEVVIKHEDGLETAGQCRLPISVVGDEARSKDAAELQARQHFMKTVRFHLGEKFIELGNARDVFFQCNRSDFPITGGKIGAAMDNVSHLWRCSIRATPCAQSIVREEK